jgi:hypothetical protein
MRLYRFDTLQRFHQIFKGSRSVAINQRQRFVIAVAPQAPAKAALR